MLLGAYFPNGSRDHHRVPYKMAYKADFLAYCERQRAEGKEVVFCGDVNTAHQEIDLARPKSNKKTTGFLPEERVWLDEVIAAGYVDTYRARIQSKREPIVGGRISVGRGRATWAGGWITFL